MNNNNNNNSNNYHSMDNNNNFMGNTIGVGGPVSGGNVAFPAE